MTSHIDLSLRVRIVFAAAVLLCSYALIWFLRRSYGGLADDAHLYALQALSRLNSEFSSHDLFLRYGSQDDFTLFTPLYAWLIDSLDLARAEAILTVLFHSWSATATWFIARRFVTYKFTWLVVGVTLVVPGYYGASGVFEYSENFLTARLPAEALSLTAIAFFLFDHRKLAWLAAVSSALMHPIMAAPLLAVLTLLSLAPAVRDRAIVAAILLAAIGLVLAIGSPSHSLSIMDPEWLHIVRARSSYLFMQNWSAADWDWALLTITSLLFSARVVPWESWKKLSYASAFVGAMGLIVTCITSYALPVALALQVQPWRWMWVATYIAVMSVPLSLVSCWRAEPTRKHACIVLCSAWILPLTWASPTFIAFPIAAAALAAAHATLSNDSKHAQYFAWFAWSMLSAACAAIVISAIPLLQLQFTTNKEPVVLERIRDLFGLTSPALVAVALAWFCTVRARHVLPPTLIAVVVAVSAYSMSGIIYQGWTQSKYLRAYSDFEHWRLAVDHRRSVWWPEDPIATWLLLQSPSYLSISQTAGLVFSRQTALEAARRARLLEAQNGHSQYGIGPENRGVTRPLTIAAFTAICADPELGYAVSSRDLPLPHLSAPKGAWSQFKLYSCDSLNQENRE